MLKTRFVISLNVVQQPMTRGKEYLNEVVCNNYTKLFVERITCNSKLQSQIRARTTLF